MKVKKLMTQFLQIDQAYYPETMGAMVVIGAPSWFNGVFSFMKSFMAPATQQKIEVRITPACQGAYYMIAGVHHNRTQGQANDNM